LEKNILVFPCGSEIGLEVHNALKFVKNLNLVGASSVADHGKYVYKNYVEGIPNVTSDDFIESFNRIIEEYKIDFVIPAHDSVVLKLAQNKAELKAEIITADEFTCEIARSKKKTYEFFSGEDFIPHMYYSVEEVNEFPVFLKPDVGQGSKGIALAKNKEELVYYTENNPDLLILEYLPGKEYTIDCFTNSDHQLLFCGMRERRRIKSGISVNSMSLDSNEEVVNIAKKINEKLNFKGVWFFQVKVDQDGKLKLLEIAPRIAGTMALYRNKGLNFPLLSIYDRLGYDVAVIDNDFNIEIDRALINRFSLDLTYERVYLDFDDTITYKDKINPFTMLYIYQCIAKDIELILITKHKSDINNTLGILKIDKSIFEEIIHISMDDEKYKYMKTDKPAIFIDDSYVERKNVQDQLNMPVFDIDSIECLIDWRV
jgi:predicted ATP-grasp superfamily ATP-dependent carboligase